VDQELINYEQTESAFSYHLLCPLSLPFSPPFFLFFLPSFKKMFTLIDSCVCVCVCSWSLLWVFLPPFIPCFQFHLLPLDREEEGQTGKKEIEISESNFFPFVSSLSTTTNKPKPTSLNDQQLTSLLGALAFIYPLKGSQEESQPEALSKLIPMHHNKD